MAYYCEIIAHIQFFFCIQSFFIHSMNDWSFGESVQFVSKGINGNHSIIRSVVFQIEYRTNSYLFKKYYIVIGKIVKFFTTFEKLFGMDLELLSYQILS